MNLWTTLGLLLTAAIGIWRFVKRLRSQKRKQAEEARKQFEEGIKNADASSITSALDRLNR